VKCNVRDCRFLSYLSLHVSCNLFDIEIDVRNVFLTLVTSYLPTGVHLITRLAVHNSQEVKV